MIKKILAGILVLVIIAQFFQPALNDDRSGSFNDIHHSLHIPDTISAILKASCYDCHSNQTNYPWYSRITPVNWWLSDHVEEGKKHLNFTEFGTYSYKRQDHKLEEIIETVKQHSMPLPSYLWMHSEAKLDEKQRIMLADWVNKARNELAANNQ